MPTMQNQAMISEVSICNQALLWLGQETIISLDDDNDKAEWFRNNYFAIRDTLLEVCMWTFATARWKSTVEDLDVWGIEYVHPIPIDWLSVRRCYIDVSCPDPTNWVQTSWRREGNNVLSRDSVIYLYGILRVTDTGKFSNLFCQALAARLAADATIPFTGNRLLQADMWALYGDKLAEAEANDGKQGTMERFRARRLTNAR